MCVCGEGGDSEGVATPSRSAPDTRPGFTQCCNLVWMDKRLTRSYDFQYHALPSFTAK